MSEIMNFRTESSYFLEIMTYPLFASLPPSPAISLSGYGRKMAVVLCLACAWYSLKRSRYLILFVSYLVVHKKTFILVMFRVLGLSVENIAI